MLRTETLMLGCLFLAAVPVAHALELQDGHASVEVRATEHRGQMQMRFADELTLVLRVSGSQVEVQLDPRRLVEGTDWRVEAEPAVSLKGSWEQSFRLAPLKPGVLNVALAPWRYRIEGSDWRTTRWPAVAVDVVSHADPESLGMPRDITAIERLPSPAASMWWLWVVGAGLVLALGFVGWRCRRAQRPSSHKTRIPEAAALAQLSRLANRHLIEQGRPDRFYTLLSIILRRYLTQRFQIPARRQTTDELESTLAGHPQLQTHAALLIGLCRRCDAVRFAGEPATLACARHSLAVLRAWIETRP